VNDEIECNAFLSRLLAIAKQREIAVFGTIHDNPQAGNEKARGHLGSEAMRRAESVIKLQRDNDSKTRTLTTDFVFGKVRNSAETLSSHFAWSEPLSMFTSCGKPNSVVGGNLRQLAKDLFATTYSFSYSELIKRMVDTGLNENYAKKRFKQLSKDNLILKDEVSGVWILNQNEFI
jgi:hypothetical protein